MREILPSISNIENAISNSLEGSTMRNIFDENEYSYYLLVKTTQRNKYSENEIKPWK
jgi:hypothetical protein